MALQLCYELRDHSPVQTDSDAKRQDHAQSHTGRVIHGRPGDHDSVQQKHDYRSQRVEEILQRESRSRYPNDNRRHEAAADRGRETQKGVTPTLAKRRPHARHGGVQDKPHSRHHKTQGIPESTQSLLESVGRVPAHRHANSAKSAGGHVIFRLFQAVRFTESEKRVSRRRAHARRQEGKQTLLNTR